MKRIKTKRVNKIIRSCQYYLEAGEQAMFRDEVRYLIREAGEDHPLVTNYLSNGKVFEFLNK